MKHYLTVTIAEKEEGRKLLSYLKKDLGLSGLKISSVKYEERGLLVNDERVTVAHILHAGEILKVQRTDSENRDRHLLAREMHLDILFEDDALIVLNKPAGVVCHPSRGHLTDALANGVRFHFDCTDPDASVHLAGRLDKDTSGVLVMAKDGITAERFRRMKEEGSFRKTYLALACGAFQEPEGRLDFPMAETRTPEGILKICRGTGEEGKQAETFYRVLDAFRLPASSGQQVESLPTDPLVSLLSVTIPTGRMHQIRFHMAEAGHPLLGDSLYGSGSAGGMCRTALHAESVTFSHPYSGELMHISAPIPEDMNRLLTHCPQRF